MKAMIFTKIEYILTDKPFHEIMHHQPWESHKVMTHDEVDYLTTEELHREFIKCEHFRNPARNLDVWIGNSEQVREVLGLEMGCWYNMNEEVKRVNRLNTALTIKAEKAVYAKWWETFYENVDLTWQLIDEKIDKACEKAKADMEEELWPKTCPPSVIYESIPNGNDDRFKQMFF